jgi:hypothetical protein
VRRVVGVRRMPPLSPRLSFSQKWDYLRSAPSSRRWSGRARWLPLSAVTQIAFAHDQVGRRTLATNLVSEFAVPLRKQGHHNTPTRKSISGRLLADPLSDLELMESHYQRSGIPSPQMQSAGPGWSLSRTCHPLGPRSHSGASPRNHPPSKSTPRADRDCSAALAL